MDGEETPPAMTEVPRKHHGSQVEDSTSDDSAGGVIDLSEEGSVAPRRRKRGKKPPTAAGAVVGVSGQARAHGGQGEQGDRLADADDDEEEAEEEPCAPAVDEDRASGPGPWPCSRCCSAGQLAWHASALRGHLDCLQTLLSLVEAAGGPLGEELALRGGTAEELADEGSLLAQSGCQMEHDRRGRSPLFYASSAGRIKCVQLLVALRPGWINQEDSDGNTAVAAACANGHGDVAMQLLSAGADPSAANSRGLTPAHVAKTPGLLETLGQYGAALEARDREGRTALFISCALGRRRAAEMLLEMDTTMTILEEPDARGDRPLAAAAANGHRAVVRLLLGHGAAWDGSNARGLIAEDIARVNGHGSVYRLLRRVRVADERAVAAKQAVANSLEVVASSGSGVPAGSALVHYTDTLLSPTPQQPPCLPAGPEAEAEVKTVQEHGGLDLFSEERVRHWAGGTTPAEGGQEHCAVDWSMTVLAASGPWAAFWDPANHACYYVHGPTGQSQWELPEDGHGPALEASLQTGATF